MQHYFQDKFRDQSKRDRTRGILADGIIRVVDAEGREGLSARKIAAETGLSVGTVYNHFDTTEDAHQFASECILIDTLDTAAVATEGVDDAAELFVSATRFILDRLMATPAWGRVVRESVMKSHDLARALSGHYARIVAMGIEQGVFRVSPGPVLYFHLSETVFTAMRAQTGASAPDTLVRETCEIGLRILGMDLIAARDAVDRVFAQ